MDLQEKDSAGEITRLQRCINDLISLLALPAVWSGNEPAQIVPTLLDALLRMLGLDFVFARWHDPVTRASMEVLRVADSCKLTMPPRDISGMLSNWLERDRDVSLPRAQDRFEAEGISIFPVPLGVHGEIGMIVAGSERADFPGQTEGLLLSVAANEASIGLREAKLLSEQKRIADELDQRVEQRTRELAERNEELKKEILERQLMEERLRREESRLKQSELHKSAILNAALDCVVAIDHEGCITEFNPAAERTLGYRRADVLGQRLVDLIVPPSLREKHREGFSRYLATGESRVLGRRLEMTALCSDGREIPVEIAITRIPQDGPPAFTGYLRDITERKRNEDALHLAHAQILRSEERWRSVFANSAVGVALTDLHGRFIAANPVYQKMLGYTEEELQQLSILDITQEEFVEPSRVLIAELLEEKRQQYQIEKAYRRKDGNTVWVRNNVSLVPGTELAPRFLMALSEDITEHKLSEEALANARSELSKVARITSLGVLTASIAHEINQPLSGIVTNASTCLRMLSGDPPNLEGARETARRTIRDGNRASDVVTRLRNLYGRKDILPEAMDLNEAAREVISLSLTELQRNRVVLRADLAHNLPLIDGDRIQLQQVILNLLRNASDAMRTVDNRPRELLIRTLRDDEHQVRLTMRDAGIGFAPEAAANLFDAFYTTKNDGMGIGLSVSRSIIEAHRGRLWAAPNDGPGATFSFTVPCAGLGASGFQPGQ